jgi:hypothetical protein
MLRGVYGTTKGEQIGRSTVQSVRQRDPRLAVGLPAAIGKLGEAHRFSPSHAKQLASACEQLVEERKRAADKLNELDHELTLFENGAAPNHAR